MRLFLHNCPILVRSTGIEDVYRPLIPFIYKGLRGFPPMFRRFVFKFLSQKLQIKIAGNYSRKGKKQTRIFPHKKRLGIHFTPNLFFLIT